MSKNLLKFIILAGAALLFVSSASADVIPTTEWTSIRGSDSYYNDMPIPIGSVIDVFDTANVHCGTDTVHTTGHYGYMSVYGDDGYGEGPDLGEALTFYVNGILATTHGPDPAVWAGKGLKEVNVSASADVSMMLVNGPDDGQAIPGGTIRYYATVRNTGLGTDFYSVLAVSEHGWIIEPKPDLSYALPGGDAIVYFDVFVPLNIYVDTDEAVYFSVVSGADASVFVDDTVVTHVMIPTSTPEEDSRLLPGTFKLYQNYPNPFNPTTTIAFNLPDRSDASIEIFNLLGQTISRVDLGGLDAGFHTFEYDATGLASGVYFYRVEAGELNDIKKMILLK